MPRTRQVAVTAVPIDAEEVPEQHASSQLDVEEGVTRPLEFDEPLTWRAGRPIPVSDLLRRLKTLFEELVSHEQEEADRTTLVPKAQELANAQLLQHRDKGVKAWTLACIVHMFRLLAPDAPYKPSQLGEIFKLFISHVIPALSSSLDPYHQQHMDTLISLTTVKSIVLLTDIPASDTLLVLLFTNCFDVLAGNGKGDSSEAVSNNLEYHMTTMLCTLVDECDQLPGVVVDIILAQFLRADPGVTAANGKPEAPEILELSPAYNMARSVCNTCHQKMGRLIGHYFGSVLVDVAEMANTSKPVKSRGRKRTHAESEDESDDGLAVSPAEDDLHEVEKAHSLLRELWRSSPDVIQNIIPHVESELGVETVMLRSMAVQTVGDMTSGIGAAGLPPSTHLQPAAFPSQSLEEVHDSIQQKHPTLTPVAPSAFPSVYPGCYQAFFDRKRDKSAQVRSVWAVAAGRILLTAAGGKGLDADQEASLSESFADMLMDQDEKVRLAAVTTIGSFDFYTIIQRLGTQGGVNISGSILHNLAERIKDPKPSVHKAAMELLSRLWGVGVGAIAEGSDRVHALLGAAPSRIFGAAYINNIQINSLIQKVLFESLLPIGYPPIKPRQTGSNNSQLINDSQQRPAEALDADAIRVERILFLVRDLDVRTRSVFFGFQQQQVSKAKYLEAFLKHCEKINTEAADEEGSSTREMLNKLINVLASFAPDKALAADHLNQFVKHHDRRSYQLIRFCYAPESDYRKIVKAMKEFTKRLEEAPSPIPAILETILPLIRSASLLVYNRSHVPSILDYSRSDENGLGSTAHEILKSISTVQPEVFRIHVLDLCQTLKRQVPSPTLRNDPLAVDTLKACLGFARRFPDGMPKDREFYQAMTSFALYGTPPKAAKHAVTVIVTSATKKEMYIKEILQKCTGDSDYGTTHQLSRLAALSQLRLLANDEIEEENDTIFAIAQKVLVENHSPTREDDLDWADDMDDELSAKIWALKIIVNGLRGRRTQDDSAEAKNTLKIIAEPVYRLLNRIVEHGGEVRTGEVTAKHYKSRMRLAAATQLLKLSCSRRLEALLTPVNFNRLAVIAQDVLPEVRAYFNRIVKKYLGQSRLTVRFYSLVFLYAFEPLKDIKESTITWLKARAAMHAKAKDNVMEHVFVRLLSLLAHHQDFSSTPEDLEDFVEYIMFYLKAVATEENISLLYHIAQRVKSVQDGIDPAKSENLYILSDLSDMVIRAFAESKGWALLTYSGNKFRLPSGLLAALPNHTLAQELAEKRFLPEGIVDRVEDLVKASLKLRKRKPDHHASQAAKKVKASTQVTNGSAATKKLPSTRKPPKASKTPKRAKVDESTPVPESERRRSTRSRDTRNYAEEDDSEDNVDLDDRQDHMDVDDDDKENMEDHSSTPPSSDPPRSDGILADEKEASPVQQERTRSETTKRLPRRAAATRK